jgi:hypothetical protein
MMCDFMVGDWKLEKPVRIFRKGERGLGDEFKATHA